MVIPRRMGLYRGWLGHDNLGDEAMWEVCRILFPAVAWHSLGTFWRNRPRTIVRRLTHRLARSVERECALFGGGTLINRSETTLRDYRLLADRLQRPVPLFGTGVASHEFWRGMAGWQDRRAEWLATFGDLPEIGVRGPLSKAYLEEAGGKNVVAVGDPAVMFHEPFDERAKALQQAKKLRLTINYGHTTKKVWGCPARLDKTMAGLLRRFQAAGIELQVVPVWVNDIPDCKRIVEMSGVDIPILPLVTNASRFLETVRTSHAVLAFKLHAAVLAACGNVPFVMIAYRPKCLDFAASIHWEHHTIQGDMACEDTLHGLCTNVMASSRAYSEAIYDHMGALKATFKSYCERTLRPLLLT